MAEEKKVAKKPAAKKPAAKKATKPAKAVKPVKKVEEKPAKVMPTEAKAVALNVRITPRKARLVMDAVRGMSVVDANNFLKNLRKAAAAPVLKVINSAAANAVNNNKLDESKLYIAEIYAGDGPRLKRYLPRAKGSASSMVKRTSHVTCVVAER